MFTLELQALEGFIMSISERSVAYTRKSVIDGLYNTIERDTELFRRLNFAECDIYYDIQSGNDDNRPNFELIWQGIKNKTITSLTITRDDRLSRKADTLISLYRDIEQTKCKFIVIEDGGEINLSNPYEWSRRANSAVKSEDERRMLKLRIKRGLEYMLSKGKNSGRATFGYEKSKKHGETIIGIERPLLRRIVEIALNSPNMHEACRIVGKELNLKWMPARFIRWMHSACLRGHVGFKTIRKEKVSHEHFDFNFKEYGFLPSDSPIYEHMLYDVHPTNRIISEEEYLAFKQKLAKNSQIWGRSSKKSLHGLRGICYCAICNSKLTIHDKPEHNLKYLKHAVNLHQHYPCKALIPHKLVETALLKELQSKAEILAQCIPSTIQDIPVEAIEIQNQIQTLESLNNPLLNDVIDKLKQQYHEHLKRNVPNTDLRTKFINCWTHPMFWQSLTEIEKFEYLKLFVKSVHITFSKQDKTIELNIKLKF